MGHRDLQPEPSWYDTYAENEFVPDNPLGKAHFPEATPRAPKCELILGDGQVIRIEESTLLDGHGSLLTHLKNQPKRGPNKALMEILAKFDEEIAARKAVRS